LFLLSDYVNFRLHPGAQMGILRREDAAGQQICAHLSPRETDGANPHWNVLCGLALAGLLSSGAAAADLPILGRDILKQLIEMNTTHAHGTTAAAKAVADRLLAAGFAPGDVALLAPPDHPEMGNVVVRLRG